MLIDSIDSFRNVFGCLPRLIRTEERFCLSTRPPNPISIPIELEYLALLHLDILIRLPFVGQGRYIYLLMVTENPTS